MDTSNLLPQHDDGDIVYENLLPSREHTTPPRTSVRRLGFSALTGILAVALIFVIVASLQGTTKSSVSQANTLHPTALDHIVVIANVPWGIVAIDGQVIAKLPDIHGTNALHLTHGEHTITLDAAPFLLQSCVISIPLATSDTCQEGVLGPGASQLVIPIYFLLSLAQLSHAQQQTLLQAAQIAVNGISSTETILPGEYYQSGAIQATQAMIST